MTELYHYGVLGMKWGVRRYQNYDGTRIKKLEKKAIRKEYRRGKKAGEHGFKMPYSRRSTGSNYNSVRDELYKTVKNDSDYKQLSKKAKDAEEKRRAFEKEYYNKRKPSSEGFDDYYDKLVSTKQYQELDKKSKAASAAKSQRISEIEKQFINRVKEAKLNDLDITTNREEAKKYVDGLIKTNYWDENVEYDPDFYYQPRK